MTSVVVLGLMCMSVADCRSYYLWAGRTETNGPWIEANIRAGLSREAAVLQIQLGRPHCQAIETLRSRAHQGSPRTG